MRSIRLSTNWQMRAKECRTVSETIDKAILELRELLTSGNSNIDIDADGNLILENYETKCECCGYVLGNTEQDGFYSRYMKCPNCGYIQYVPNCKRVPPFWRCKVVDKEGKAVLDFDGTVRLFEGDESAKEYILYCKMEDKWKVQRDQPYGFDCY